ncbi:MAG TPA: DUF6602 domain-containing protein [Verrucomicrobiae bacterium]|nr:DUF6602 domain-containing protein [Verrucomicrobiae bacterium]
MKDTDTGERIRRYFRQKATELLAVSDAAVCEHPTLTGGHREAINRVYLSSILPRRFEIGRGMVYGLFGRSKEADIVIWDAANYPALPLQDHSFFFAQAVRLVMEVKSQWSEAEFMDVRRKTAALKQVWQGYEGGSLSDRIHHLEASVAALQEGLNYDGTLIAQHTIGTAAMFLKGGQSIDGNTYEIDASTAQSDWPDVTLLLSAGKLVVKVYENQHGFICFYDYGEDSLLAFTSAILSLLQERSVQVEDPLFLLRYAPSLANTHPIVREFDITYLTPMRRPFWSKKPQ